jgi:hypothetical protein
MPPDAAVCQITRPIGHGWNLQVVNAVIRIETSNPGSSTPSLAT